MLRRQFRKRPHLNLLNNNKWRTKKVERDGYRVVAHVVPTVSNAKERDRTTKPTKVSWRMKTMYMSKVWQIFSSSSGRSTSVNADSWQFPWMTAQCGPSIFICIVYFTLSCVFVFSSFLNCLRALTQSAYQFAFVIVVIVVAARSSLRARLLPFSRIHFIDIFHTFLFVCLFPYPFTDSHIKVQMLKYMYRAWPNATLSITIISNSSGSSSRRTRLYI